MREFDRGFIIGLYVCLRLIQKTKNVEEASKRIKNTLVKILDEKLEEMLKDLPLF